MPNQKAPNAKNATVRDTRSFRKLAASVNEYLDESGNWIDGVDEVLIDLNRLTRQLDGREQELLRREKKMDDREANMDRLLAQLTKNPPEKASAQKR